jgi:hypothetical protein
MMVGELAIGSVFDMVAGALNILAEASKSAATGAKNCDEKKQESDAGRVSFHEVKLGKE